MKFQIYRKFVHIIGRGKGGGIHKESHIKKIRLKLKFLKKEKEKYIQISCSLFDRSKNYQCLNGIFQIILTMIWCKQTRQSKPWTSLIVLSILNKKKLPLDPALNISKSLPWRDKMLELLVTGNHIGASVPEWIGMARYCHAIVTLFFISWFSQI